jgi:hypothetical protein
MTSGLLIAQLALYAPLTLPTLYLLYSHGRHGLLAWLYLLAFCVLRITGAAMGLNDPHNTGAQIISSIGLSPLLLSIDGMLHEAYVAQKLTPTHHALFPVHSLRSKSKCNTSYMFLL